MQNPAFIGWIFTQLVEREKKEPEPQLRYWHRMKTTYIFFPPRTLYSFFAAVVPTANQRGIGERKAPPYFKGGYVTQPRTRTAKEGGVHRVGVQQRGCRGVACRVYNTYTKDRDHTDTAGDGGSVHCDGKQSGKNTQHT